MNLSKQAVSRSYGRSVRFHHLTLKSCNRSLHSKSAVSTIWPLPIDLIDFCSYVVTWCGNHTKKSIRAAAADRPVRCGRSPLYFTGAVPVFPCRSYCRPIPPGLVWYRSNTIGPGINPRKVVKPVAETMLTGDEKSEVVYGVRHYQFQCRGRKCEYWTYIWVAPRRTAFSNHSNMRLWLLQRVASRRPSACRRCCGPY